MMPLKNWLTFALLCLLLCLPYGTRAEDEETIATHPTVATLRATHIPKNDPYLIAERFYGITAPAEAPVTSQWERNDRDEFWVTNTSSSQMRLITAELRVVSQYAYFWVELQASVSERDLRDLSQAFDTNIYHQVRDLWGSEPLPGVDGDPRLHILFANGLGGGTAAYFARRHNYPIEIMPQSNAREMFFVNLSTNSQINTSFLQSTLAHEFQHMIRANIKANEDSWLNEGFSTFTEGYLGYIEVASRYPQAFLSNPETQLNTFGIASNRLAEYGAGFLFVTYLYDRLGLDGIQALSQHPATGMFAVDDVVKQFGISSADVFFGDWVLANLIRVPGYFVNYRSLPHLPPVATRRLNGREIQMSRTLSQYATHYYELADATGVSVLDITLELPTTVPLVPIEAYSGDKFWYSNRGDVSHTRLYRAFDLRDVTSATLTYQIWYDIEPDWDYGYVLISTDDGATWQSLFADEMTADYNPFGNLYGDWGYTGLLGRWYKEQIILDDFAGQEVIISFDFISDDAVNHAGMVLDDIAIQEIGYFADLEADNGGWTSEGWVWVANEVPQQAWLQVIQRRDDELHIEPFLTHGALNQRIALAPDAHAVYIAISPFAPVTTVQTDYYMVLRLADE